MVKFNYKALLLGGAAAALFVGCGESGDLSSDVISAECNTLFRCAGEDDDSAYNRIEYGTEANCRASESDNDISAEYQRFIDAGTVVLDQGAADRCLSALRATCTETLAQRQACNRVFVGQVADGGGCQEDVECVSGQCSSDGFEECGTCATPIATGSACDFGDYCAQGANGERGYCNGVVCEVEEGQDLLTEDAALGEDCDYEQLCEAGLFCQDGTCARWREVGDACDPYSDSCGRGAFCLQDEDNEDEGTCVAVRIEDGPGEDCGILADEVVVCDVSANLYCNDGESGVCALFDGDGETGDYCDESAECVDGLRCLSGQCLSGPQADGFACNGNSQCLSGNCAGQNEPPFGFVCQPALVCP